MGRTFGFLFALVALAAGGIGFISLSEATFGVGVIALGLMAGIFARLFQASAHHDEIEALLIQQRNHLELASKASAESAAQLLASTKAQTRILSETKDSSELPTP